MERTTAYHCYWMLLVLCVFLDGALPQDTVRCGRPEFWSDDHQLSSEVLDEYMPGDELIVKCKPGMDSVGTVIMFCSDGGGWEIRVDDLFCDETPQKNNPPPPINHGPSSTTTIITTLSSISNQHIDKPIPTDDHSVESSVPSSDSKEQITGIDSPLEEAADSKHSQEIETDGERRGNATKIETGSEIGKGNGAKSKEIVALDTKQARQTSKRATEQTSHPPVPPGVGKDKRDHANGDGPRHRDNWTWRPRYVLLVTVGGVVILSIFTAFLRRLYRDQTQEARRHGYYPGEGVRREGGGYTGLVTFTQLPRPLEITTV